MGEISAFTDIERFSMKNLAIIALISLLPCVAAAQSNVPIDSPRGNYEGAENIHWYQQRGLRSSDNVGLVITAGNPWLCNENDLSFDCFGDPIYTPQRMYYSQGTPVVNVAVFVDTRITEEFDFPFRRAIDAIRRTNDAFMRSGALVQLRVTDVRYFNFDAQGFSDNPREIANQLDSDPRYIEDIARQDGADVLMFVRNAAIDFESERILCGLANAGVAVPENSLTPKVILACEGRHPSDGLLVTPLTAPHEFGHIFGLAHEPVDRRVEPHLSFGQPHQNSRIVTIMSTKSDDSIVLPFFSSPNLLIRGDYWGSSSSNATKAINQAAANVALFWEIKNGQLGQPEVTSSSASSTDRKVWSLNESTAMPYSDGRIVELR